MSDDRLPVSLRLAEEGGDDATVCRLMTDYMSWALPELRAQFAVDLPAEPAHTPASLVRFRAPGGVIAIAEVGGVAAGVGALRSLDATTVELKRMYVAPEFRSGHVGSAILDYLLLMATERIGATVAVLDTCRFMADAQRLYQSRGFIERSPYDGTEIPVELQRYWRFFERPLGSNGSPDPAPSSAAVAVSPAGAGTGAG